MKFVLAVFLFASGLAAQEPLPTITVPGKKVSKSDPSAPSSVDSRTLTTAILPRALNNLGPLRDDVLAYFSMDSTDAGGLAWSRKPISVHATADAVAVEKDGRRYVDFHEGSARVDFDPPLVVGPRFTLAAWLEFPMQDHNGIAWTGDRDVLLCFQKNSLICWNDVVRKGFTWAEAGSKITGWHHLAIVSDERAAQTFLDGKPLASIRPFGSTKLICFGGNHTPGKNEGICGMDEHYIFSRRLTAEEVVTVMNSSKPLSQK